MLNQKQNPGICAGERSSVGRPISATCVAAFVLITDFSEIRIRLKFDPESPAPNYAPD
jgi:hypothetical protein